MKRFLMFSQFQLTNFVSLIFVFSGLERNSTNSSHHSILLFSETLDSEIFEETSVEKNHVEES
jgi:hypothetical protein